MQQLVQEDRHFKDEDYSGRKIPVREFSNCEFNNCNFNKANLNNIDFIDCKFINCNLSLASIENTKLKTVHFSGCKLMGVDFSKCDDFLFAVSFENCQMDYCLFYKKKLKKTPFNACSLKDVDFAEADLSAVIFKGCDLLNASFINTILEKADFRRAVNYSFDPAMNKMKKAKFSQSGVAGLLTKFNIDIEL